MSLHAQSLFCMNRVYTSNNWVPNYASLRLMLVRQSDYHPLRRVVSGRGYVTTESAVTTGYCK